MTCMKILSDVKRLLSEKTIRKPRHWHSIDLRAKWTRKDQLSLLRVVLVEGRPLTRARRALARP